jgi:hypothetical protein
MLSNGLEIVCYRLLLGANWVRKFLPEQTNSFLACRSMAQVVLEKTGRSHAADHVVAVRSSQVC